MTFSDFAHRGPPPGLLERIGQALPVARTEAARAVDRVEALQELLEQAAVHAHRRARLDVYVGDLLGAQPDESARSRLRALLDRAGVDPRKEDRHADIARAVTATKAPAAA